MSLHVLGAYVPLKFSWLWVHGSLGSFGKPRFSEQLLVSHCLTLALELLFLFLLWTSGRFQHNSVKAKSHQWLKNTETYTDSGGMGKVCLWESSVLPELTSVKLVSFSLLVSVRVRSLYWCIYKGCNTISKIVEYFARRFNILICCDCFLHFISSSFSSSFPSSLFLSHFCPLPSKMGISLFLWCFLPLPPIAFLLAV